MLVDEGLLVGEICHIEAAEPGGPRHNPDQSDEERRDFNNLVIFCPTHHTIVDGAPERFPVEWLKAKKREHEALHATAGYKIPSEVLERLFKRDEREAVFKATVLLIRRVLQSVKLSLEDVMAFSAAIEDADMLFDDDLAEYLEDVYQHAVDLMGICSALDNRTGQEEADFDLPFLDTPKRPDPTRRAELIDRRTELALWFRSQHQEARGKFQRYLGLQQVLDVLGQLDP